MNYGSVENFCRDLNKKIMHIDDMLSRMSLPETARRNMVESRNAMQSVYWDLVDSDLYRR